MATLRLLPNAPHFREFQNDPITGHHYTNTCGETALAEAMVLATPKIESTADAINLMTSLTREMMDLGWADRPNGATTTGNLYLEARRRGFTVASPYYRWTDPIPDGVLHPALLQYAGIKPIVLMVTNAGPGLTAIDGSHPERGVRGHFITIVGLADEGYITEDGDNNVISQHLVVYPWASIKAAHVTGFLMLEPQTEGTQTLGVPANWKDDGKVITASNGVKVEAGFANYIRTHYWPAANVPLGPEYTSNSIEPGNPAIGKGSRIDFVGAGDDKADGVVSLGWTESRNVYRIWTGQDLAFYAKQNKAQADEIAALKASQNPPLTAQQKADLAVMAAVRTAMGTH